MSRRVIPIAVLALSAGCSGTASFGGPTNDIAPLAPDETAASAGRCGTSCVGPCQPAELAPAPGGLSVLATSGTEVYFASLDLFRVSTSGGAPQRLATSDTGDLYGIDVFDGHVYWSTGATLRRAPTAGGARRRRWPRASTT